MSVFRLVSGVFPEAWVRRWPHVRAALITFHVVAVLMMAFPAPAGVMSKKAWAEPAVQDEIRLFADRISGFGTEVTPEELESFLWDFSKDFLDVRKTVLKPVKPYGEYLGARQGWRMFSAPHRYPSRLVVDIDRGNGKWEPLYESRSDDATWMREQLDHHRLRRLAFLHAWKQYRRNYKYFTRFLARKAAVEFPDAKRIRVRHLKFRTATPEEARRGEFRHEEKWQDRRIHNLEEFR